MENLTIIYTVFMENISQKKTMFQKFPKELNEVFVFTLSLIILSSKVLKILYALKEIPVHLMSTEK